MNYLTVENTEEQKALDKALSETIDKEIISDLEHYLEIVRKKSRALASSLKRCFDNARKSKRYVIVYNLGKEDARKRTGELENWPPSASLAKGGRTGDEKLEKYLENYLKDYFEKNDFMHYREFVRLLRACTIDVGGDTSFHIKEMYNDFFLGKRLIEAYKLGLSSNP